MKKLNKHILALIVLSITALVLFGLSLGSAFYTVNRAIDSIDAIGEIKAEKENEKDYTLTSSKKKLDLAILNFDKLDKNISLDEKVTNKDKLDAARKEIVEVSINLANNLDKAKIKLDYQDEEIAKYVAKVDEYKELYLSDEEFKELLGYATYEYLKERYKEYLTEAPQKPESGNSGSSSAEEPEIC